MNSFSTWKPGLQEQALNLGMRRMKGEEQVVEQEQEEEIVEGDELLWVPGMMCAAALVEQSPALHLPLPLDGERVACCKYTWHQGMRDACSVSW